MRRAGVLRMLPGRGLQARHDVAHHAVGLAGLAVPPVPRARGHHRVGVQRDDIGIVGEARHHAGHRRRVREFERIDVALLAQRRAIAGGARRLCLLHRLVGNAVAHGQGLDQRLLARRRGACGGARSREIAANLADVVPLRLVDVRSERVGHAPGAHRATRVERPCRPEAARCLGVLEAVGQQQALLKQPPGLGFARRGHETRGAEAVDRRRPGLLGVGKRVRAGAEQRAGERRDQPLHDAQHIRSHPNPHTLHGV